MSASIFSLNKEKEYRKAGSTDLMEILPPPGNHPLYIEKWILKTVAYGIFNHEFIHLSGPTGSAKSALIEYLFLQPKNFKSLCRYFDYGVLPLKLYPIEMAIYETPGELYQRRALKNGSTFDEKSNLVEALEEIDRTRGESYPLIWLREMGRVHSSSIQGGLLNLMTKGDIILPDGSRINGQGIAIVADSNYQAAHDSNHTLVSFDDALKRRFCLNPTLDYLSFEQEIQVLNHILRKESIKPDDDLIMKIVQLGHLIRENRAEGNLQSLTPPTIWGYLAFLRLSNALPSLDDKQRAMVTLIGNSSSEDLKRSKIIMNEVFGVKTADDEQIEMDLNLF